MAGTGPAPKPSSRTRHKPIRGQWQAAPGFGWQHGPIPEPPEATSPAAREIWLTWMKSWWASRWTPEDLPGLFVTLGLYDQVQDYLREPLIEKEYVTTKGLTRTVWVPKPNPSGELRQYMDNYGITPKGKQDRRWSPPKDEPELANAAVNPTAPSAPKPASRYGGLKVVGE